MARPGQGTSGVLAGHTLAGVERGLDAGEGFIVFIGVEGGLHPIELSADEFCHMVGVLRMSSAEIPASTT